MSRSKDTALATAVLALATGALMGAVTALLLAPTSGKETRRKLSDLQEGAGNRIKRYTEEARYKLGKPKSEDLHYDGGDAWI